MEIREQVYDIQWVQSSKAEKAIDIVLVNGNDNF